MRFRFKYKSGERITVYDTAKQVPLMTPNSLLHNFGAHMKRCHARTRCAGSRHLSAGCQKMASPLYARVQIPPHDNCMLPPRYDTFPSIVNFRWCKQMCLAQEKFVLDGRCICSRNKSVRIHCNKNLPLVSKSNPSINQTQTSTV